MLHVSGFHERSLGRVGMLPSWCAPRRVGDRVTVRCRRCYRSVPSFFASMTVLSYAADDVNVLQVLKTLTVLLWVPGSSLPDTQFLEPVFTFSIGNQILEIWTRGRSTTKRGRQ
jgi:hypothetical protein